MKHALSWRRAFRVGASTLLALAGAQLPAHPLAAAPPLDGGVEPEPDPPEAGAAGFLQLENLPLVGSTVTVSSSNVSVSFRDKTFPVSTYAWTLVEKPAGSAASLGVGATSATLLLDRPGAYRVRYTACTTPCKVRVGTVSGVAPTQAFDLVIQAKTEFYAPPPADPILPDQTGKATYPTYIPDEDARCDGGGGFVDPQWVTAKYWNGPADYELLEGAVDESHVSGNDNLLNHSSQDWNLQVKPDPAFRRLLNQSTAGSTGVGRHIEVEWETNEYPEDLRPLPGDRVSLVGYHILDCGHGDNGHYRTEIHPPVLSAVHRPRAILLPPDAKLDLDRDGVANETVGTNVWVSGVVTDLWVNAYSGEATSNESWSGLHQPFDGQPITAPANLRRSYTFNVYLPESPQRLAKAIGKADAKPAPLYFGVRRNPRAPSSVPLGPAPRIVPITEGGVTYLRVTLDLTGTTGTKFAQQIVAGWVYPSPDNWQLQRYQVGVSSIKIKDNHEWVWGDWHFGVGTNNTTNEWTKIFDCQGCIREDTTYSPTSSAWAGATAADGRLWGDALLLPHQPLRLTSTGYEDDNFVDEGISRIDTWLAKTTHASARSSADYDLRYFVTQVGPELPTLSAAGRTLYDDYKIVGTPPTNTLPVAALAVAFAPMEEEVEEARPTDAIAILDHASLAKVATAKVDRATYKAGAVSLDKVGSLDPTFATRLDVTLARLRKKIDAKLVTADLLRRTALLDQLARIRAAIPKAAWNKHFADLSAKP